MNNKPNPTTKQIKQAMKEYNNNATRNNLSHAEARAARRGASGVVIVALIVLVAASIALSACSFGRPVAKVETTPNGNGTWSRCTHYADEMAPVVSCEIVNSPSGVNWSSRQIQ